MKTISLILETRQKIMLSEYPDQQELTESLFADISDLLAEDLDAVTRKSAKQKLVFSSIADILRKARAQDVRKKYATDLLDLFLDPKIASYLERKLNDGASHYSAVIIGARAELHCAQWSDATSKHWQRAIGRFSM